MLWRQVARLRVTGVVSDEPMPRGDSLDLTLEDVRLPDRSVTGRLLVRVPRTVAPTAGDVVALEATIRAPDPADLEEIAYRERLRRQGIGALARAWEVRVVGHRSAPIGDAFGAFRRWLLDGLVRTVPEPEASLGAGILLGVRAGMDPAVRDAFAVAGLSHVVAISGWNVAIVVALIMSATRRLRERFGPILPAVVALAAVAGYVVLVGASPAVVRAALMAGALAGRAARRVAGPRGIGPDGRRRGHAPRHADRAVGRRFPAVGARHGRADRPGRAARVAAGPVARRGSGRRWR